MAFRFTIRETKPLDKEALKIFVDSHLDDSTGTLQIEA